MAQESGIGAPLTDDELASLYGDTGCGGGGSGDDGDGSAGNSGDGAGGGGSIDPATVLGGNSGNSGNADAGDDDEYYRDANGNYKYNADGSRRRKRKRRGGTRPQKAHTKSSVSVSGIEALLFSTHNMLAAVSKVPEFACEHSETKPLAEAIAEVAKHYPDQVIDPVTLAWFNLTLVGGTFYGSRIIVMRERMKAERAEKRGSGRTNGGPVAVPDQPFTPTNAPPQQPLSKLEVPPNAFTGDLSTAEIKPTKLDG